MTKLEDIKEIADELLEQTKQYLIDDGEISPLVFPVKEGKCEVYIPMDLSEGDRTKYQMLSMAFRAGGIDAVIMINDAYVKTSDPEASECLIVFFKGIGIPAHGKTALYHRDEHGNIVFDEATEWSDKAQDSLMPNWWSEETSWK